MRPLSELPLDGIAGIFADLDDTLTWKGALSPEGYAAFCRAAAVGLRLIVATGRAGGFAEVLSVLFPVAAVVAENGGYAVLRGGEQRYWDGAEVRSEQARRLRALVEDVALRLPFVRTATDFGLRRVDVAFDLHERQDLTAAQTAALAELVAAHGARRTVSSIHLHAHYGDHDKAKMLARLAADLWQEDEGDVRERYLFIGDSPNDQAAFAFFPRSIGVANVAPHLRALDPPPAFVTPSPAGLGVAEVIDALLARRAAP